MTYFQLILVLFGVVSCTQPVQDLTVLSFEKDLIPEGIAIDPSSGKLYLSSLNKSKIVTSNLDGSNPTNFIESNEYGYLPGFGMTVKGDRLYALGNGLFPESNSSILLVLDVTTSDSISSYVMKDTTFMFLNDLAVRGNNQVFVTESNSNRIYSNQGNSGELGIFMDNEEVPHSNGIAISGNQQLLYLASEKGIRIVDIETKEILNPSNEYAGIDGLKFYENSLIGIVNIYRDESKNGVFRYYLNEEGTTITRKEKILAYTEKFQVPTTFDIFNGHLYFVINSQLDNLDQDTNQIVDEKKLKSYLLMKVKLE